MFKKLSAIVFCFIIAVFALGCSTQDIPQAHKGREFGKTGVWALYAGTTGFTGPVVGPGNYYTGMYNEYKTVECAEKTEKESLTALTKDGVQFNLDIYTRYSANCDDDKSVQAILDKMSPGYTDDKSHPEWVHTIFAIQLYQTFIRPALGESVREAVGPYVANDINSKRDAIFEDIKKRFSLSAFKPGELQLVKVGAINLSNLNFPEAMAHANTDRAVQSVLRDKAIAERERITAEIENSKMKQQLASNDALNEVAKIDAVGAALHRNPEYYLRDIYYYAGDKGNMVILLHDPSTVLQLTPKK
jgi:regulator of protease activity HflC (stomatin/prohibitin superfamily)